MESPRRRWRAPRRRPKVRSGQLRQVAAEIQQTAEDLARIRTRDGALSRPTCKAEWEACPEHGATLTSTRGSSTCRVCGRSWDWDRFGLPCTEPAAFRVQDREGKDMLLCAGHAIAAREQMEGATVQPIEPEG